MKNLIFALIVLSGQTVFASSSFVPSEFMAERPALTKMKTANTNEAFSENIGKLLDLQQSSLETVATDHTKVSLTQMLTSFSVSKSGLFGLSALSTNSATTLFWNKKKTTPKSDEPKTFTFSESDDELSLQMKIDDVTEYLVKENKVKDASKLREGLDRVIRRGHQIFTDVENLETPNWKVSGYRLDLSINASGVVAPFTKVGENVRLWLEWNKPVRAAKPVIADNKVTRFVSRILADTEVATSKINMPNFELKTLYVGFGEDLKTGFFGLGNATYGFVGYVRFAKKPKTTLATLALNDSETTEEYPVIQDASDNKSRSKLVTISSAKIRNGIEKSLKFAQFFTQKADRMESTHWELSTIREIATITKSGLFGLSTLSTKGVFTFMFNRKAPQQLAPEEFIPSTANMTLIRLSFVTVLGINIPEVANFELRPNVELFWK